MKQLIILMLVVLLSIIAEANAMQINITSPQENINFWLSNQSIHYTYFNGTFNTIPIININRTGISNFSYLYPEYYYNQQYQGQNTSTGIIYLLGIKAYPQYFISSMIKNNFAGCGDINSTNSNSNNFTYNFFNGLCEIYKTVEVIPKNAVNITREYTLNKSTMKAQVNKTPQYNNTKNFIQVLIAENMPNDVFTKQLYELYANYSEACTKSGTGSSNLSQTNLGIINITDTICLGSKDNYSLPYFEDYIKYMESLYIYMETWYYNNPNILYYSLLYDMKNKNIFPIYKTPNLLQNKILLAGVYPSILPSGRNAEQLLNKSQLGIPINYFKDYSTYNLTKNGVDIVSGNYTNVSLDIAYKNYINAYSYYNLSTNSYPFFGSLSTGSLKYYDSCSGGIGLGEAKSDEINQMQNSFYKTMSQNKIYPQNYYQNIEGSKYGPSIIEAVPSNINIGNNKIVYGAKYYNKTIAYESNLTEPLTENQTLIQVTIPVNSIKFPQNLHQLFARVYNNYSYDMNFYTFNVKMSPTQFNITHGQYQKVIYVKENNQTVPETITCFTSSVSAQRTYNSTKVFISSEPRNYNNYEESYVNVSANLTPGNAFKYNKNGFASGINYTYDLYQSSQPSIRSRVNLTIPSGSEFQIETENGTLLDSFTASYAPNTTILGAPNLYLYSPTYVYPDTYASLPAYYPTISSFADNIGYLLTYNEYRSGIRNAQYGGLLNTIDEILATASTYIWSRIENLFGQNITTSALTSTPQGFIIQSEHETVEYYLEGCPYTKIGNVCVVPEFSYILNNSRTKGQANYNLLNPILYTQNMYYASLQSTESACTKELAWKELISQAIPSVSDWSTCNGDYNYSGVTGIYSTDQQLLFNTTWKNFSNYSKTIFLNELENLSLYNETYYSSGFSNIKSIIPTTTPTQGIYSILYPQSYAYQNENSSIKAIRIINQSAKMVIEKGYNELRLFDCKFNLCFSSTLLPTAVYTELFYTSDFIGNNTYKISIYPNRYGNASEQLGSNTILTLVNPVLNLTYTLKSVKLQNLRNITFYAKPTFYIKLINSNNVSMAFENNTLYVKVPTITPYGITLNFAENNNLPQVKERNNTYTFIIPKQKLSITASSMQNPGTMFWEVLFVIIIVLIILWKTGYFEPVKSSFQSWKVRLKS